MLDMLTANDNFALVELTDTLEFLGFVGRNEVIKRARLAIRAVLGVFILLIVEDLIFKTNTGLTLRAFFNQILDAAVAARRNPPFKFQIEIGELLLCNQIAAVRAAHVLETAVLHYPPLGKNVRRIAPPTAA